MTIEENDPDSPKRGARPSPNYALYAIVTVGVLFLIVRVLLHMTQPE